MMSGISEGLLQLKDMLVIAGLDLDTENASVD